MSTGLIRKVAVLATAGALLIGTAGCQGGGEAGGGGDDKKLEFWTFIDPNSPDDPRGAVLKGVVDDFNAHNSDGVTVTVRSINFAKIDAEVIKATASGSGPDIVNVYSNQLPTYVDAGVLQDITQYAGPELTSRGKDQIFPADSVTFGGKVMAMPWETRAWLLWYRADKLKAAGVAVPKTLEEVGTAAAALRKKNEGGLAVGFSSAGLGADFVEKFVPLTWANGGEVLTDDKAAFSSPGGVAALEQLKQWRADDAFGDEVLSMGADDVVNAVKASTASMAIEGSYRVAAARKGEGIGDNLKAVPMPSSKAGTPMQTPVAGQTLAVGANAKNSQAAWDFIKQYTSAEAQEKFAAAGVLPVLASVYDSPAVKVLPNAMELKTWRDYVLTYGRPNPVSTRFNQLSDQLVSVGQEVVFKNADPAASLKAAADKYNTAQ